MSSLGQGDDKVTKDLLYIGQANVNAVDAWGNNVLKYSFVSPNARKLASAMMMTTTQNNNGNISSTNSSSTTTNNTNNNNKSNNNQEENDAATTTTTVPLIEVEGNDRNMNQLLSQNVDVTVCDADGNYPLHWLGRGCSITFSYKGCRVLLRNPVNISTEAQKKGYHISRAKELLKQGAGITTSLNGCNKFGQTPLHVALCSGLTTYAALLLQQGANPNVVDVHGNLPLHVACTGWCMDSGAVVTALINQGKGKCVTKGRFNPDDVALGLDFEQRETERVERILSTSLRKHVTAPPSILSKQLLLRDLLVYPNAKGHGPLHVVCGSCANQEHYATGNNGSNGSNGGPLGYHSLPINLDDSQHSEVQVELNNQRKKERLSLLQDIFLSMNSNNNGNMLKKIVDVNTRSSTYGLTPLHYVCRASDSGNDPHLDEATVDLLVQHGGDVNAVDAQTRAGGGGPRYSPLHYALKKSPELAWHLLRVDGANPHPATANPPALLLACEQGVDESMVGYLVTHGENPNITGNGLYQGHRKYSGTGLMLASSNGHDHIVRALVLSLPEVIDVNAVRQHDGRSALHLASFNGHSEVVQHLVEDGHANKYLQDVFGETCIISSVRGVRPNVLKFLLLEIDDHMKADHALTMNVKEESALSIAETMNLKLFSQCQRQNASNSQLNALDRSNQIVKILLNLLTSTQNQQFTHVHECFSRGMNMAQWYEMQEENQYA